MIKFYDTLSRSEKTFKPLSLDNSVKIYSCGPTVYSYAHIGNLRAALFTDFLKRTLRYFGYEINDVLNITDVGHLTSDEDDGEDKMLKASKKEKKDPYEIARFYEDQYIKDISSLNIIKPKYMPRATEHIKEQLDMIQKLDSNGYTYKTDDGIYLDVSKLRKYGQLSRQSLEDKKEGARVNKNSQKKNPQDFALWKFTIGDNKNHIMKWDSNFGEGFPGWHIECSAMGYKYLGDNIDIHTGGTDHIPIHHENEIAQNEGSKTIKKVNFWMHNDFVLVDSKKMSKSLGNVYYMQDIISKNYSPLAFREICLKSHYRKQMNFTWESLKSGEIGVNKINEFLNKLENLKPSKTKSNEIKPIIREFIIKFETALEDDLNTAIALATVYEFINKINSKDKLNSEEIESAKEFIIKTDKVLGLIKKKESIQSIPSEILELANKRLNARENKDFKTSDEIRDQIKNLGYEIKDDKSTKIGYIINKL